MKKLVFFILICFCTRLYGGAIGIMAAKSTAMGFGLHGGFAARVIDGKFHPAGNIGVSGNLFYNFSKEHALEAAMDIKTIANNTWDYYFGMSLGYVFFAQNNWFFRAGTGVDFSLQKPDFYFVPYIGGGYILGINDKLGMTFSAAAEVPVKMQPWTARGVDITLGVGMIFATQKGESNDGQ